MRRVHSRAMVVCFLHALVLIPAACGGGNSSNQGTPPGDDGGNANDAADGGGPGPGNDAAKDSGPIVAPQPISPDIVVDQFGYRTLAEKIAVIKSPQTG